MWIVTVHRDNGYSGEHYSKRFQEQEDAEDFFYEEVKDEFRGELEGGLVSDQEIQNIVAQGIYVYEDEDYEVTLTLETVEEELNDGYGEAF